MNFFVLTSFFSIQDQEWEEDIVSLKKVFEKHFINVKIPVYVIQQNW